MSARLSLAHIKRINSINYVPICISAAKARIVPASATSAIPIGRNNRSITTLTTTSSSSSPLFSIRSQTTNNKQQRTTSALPNLRMRWITSTPANKSTATTAAAINAKPQATNSSASVIQEPIPNSDAVIELEIPESERREYTAEQIANNRSVAIWLLTCCGMVFAMVVLGGVTRLTESGLSIVEWKPITGAIPPLTQQQWEEEFAKYKNFPEFQRYNSQMTVEEFKKIFFFEWLHRLWGRSIGIAFAAPLVYFAVRKKLDRSLLPSLIGLFAIGGAQGALGWYMVKSGLEERKETDYIPRVSPYRLAAHLGTAFVLYVGLLWSSLGLLSTGRSKITSLDQVFRSVPPTAKMVSALANLRRVALPASLLVFVTAMSGAFVAGLDAGLIYNEFPLMGGRLAPPAEDLFHMRPVYKNFFENDATVQFQHRLLAMTTLATVIGVWYLGRSKTQLTGTARTAVNALMGMASLQVALGITTLLTYVPTPIAAAHQAGSLTLLTIAVWLLHELRRVPRIRLK